MRRFYAIAALPLLALPLTFRSLPASAAPAGYFEAERRFEQGSDSDLRILAQVLLISAGYGNAVPVDHFNVRIMRAIQGFQTDNGFNPNGMLDKVQGDRLIAVASEKLALWGFQKVSYPGQSIAIWAPLGLGLDLKQNATGLHYKDRRGRLELDMVSLGGKSVVGVYNGLLTEKQRDQWAIHYAVFKKEENWFVVSATAPDGTDHYYRYHQDGDFVTGFALEWNNAIENINAERIAVLMSGSLWSAMTGAPFIDPPSPPAEARGPRSEVPQPVAVPVVPKPPTTNRFKSGTGFFVSDAGHLITNAHVVDGCSGIAVKSEDGSVIRAERVATDITNDLALLKVEKRPARIVALRVGARLGEGVEAFGFPHSDLLASSGNFTLGNVTALSGMHDDSRFMQISAPVQSGNSGGPLLDGSGNLIGVVTSKLNAVKMLAASDDLPQNVNFAVKSAMVANFLDANRVTYKLGAPGAAMQPADIADQARAVSGFVACQLK